MDKIQPQSNQKPPSGCQTIRLPITEADYDRFLDEIEFARTFLAHVMAQHPEIFPAAMLTHYVFYGFTAPSRKMGLRCRRVRAGRRSGPVYTLAPSFVMPYMCGATEAASLGLLLLRYNVPYWVVAFVLGRNAMYWYRLASSLDDSLHQWLPPFQYVDPTITLRQLLSHTSGIFNFTDHPLFWNRLWTNVERAWAPEEVLRNFVSQPVFAPGSRFEYSNTNYLLLNMVIRAATGSSVSSLYRDRFWNPLNMTGTFVGAEEVVTGDVAHAWADHKGDGWLEDISDKIGPSTYTLLWPYLISTAEDLAKWAEALYGGQVLDASSLDEMLNFTPVTFASYWTGYGLGAMRYNLDGEGAWPCLPVRPTA